MLLPTERTNKKVEWKIWVLCTILKSFDIQAEDEKLLLSPRREISGIKELEVDVFIIGGGNA